MVINKTHPNLSMENPTPGFSFSCITEVSHVSFHKCKRHGVDCHVGNPVSFLPCFGALMMNLTSSLYRHQQVPETSRVRTTADI